MRLPSIKPKKVVSALKKVGFEEIRQSGSHLVLANKQSGKIIPIPIHSKNIKRGLLRAIINQSGLTLRQFKNLM